MGSVARTISKPFEWLGDKAGELVGSIGSLLTPKMPEVPVIEPTPPAEPAGPGASASEGRPGSSSPGPGASASESSEAQNERLRILAAKSRKKTRTMLTSAQGVTEAAGAVKKKLLGE